jgi:cardiolipin synthase
MYEPYARWISELVSQFPHQPAMATEGARPLSELVDSRLGSPMLSGNRVELLTEPYAILFALAQDIREATASCYLEFYIWQTGGWADQVAEALIDAAARGVDCRLLLDSVGSAGFFKGPWPERLQTAGAALVGASRLLLGVHYLSDLVAGALLGGGCALWALGWSQG